MKDHHPLDDDLKAAFRSVRDAYDGTNPESNTTLQRALFRTRVRERRRSFTRWVVLPIAAVFVVSTAWAGVTGKLELSFASVLESFHAERTRAKEPSPSSVTMTVAAASTATEMPPVEATSVAPPTDAPPEIARSAPSDLPVVEAPATEIARSVPSDPPVVEAPSSAPARSATGSAPRPAPRRVDGPKLVASVTPPASATFASEPDPDAALFAEAHRLHFIERDPARALAAWDRYLATAPSGRLAPEARYNRALALVRLGRVAEAKTELAAFAGGAYGSYRRDEAKALLDALSRDATARP